MKYELTTDLYSYTKKLIAKKGEKAEKIDKRGEVYLLRIGERTFSVHENKVICKEK